MRVGLVLGTFAPLHQGHEFLIATAINECDHVVVMVYEDSCTTIPVRLRAKWIRSHFAGRSIEAIECYGCPQQVGYTAEIMEMHNEYILNTVGDKGITHFYSSEKYGAHVSNALGCVDRRVDEARASVPICGTEIREYFDQWAIRNPEIRGKISDNVYKDLVTKVLFVGAESTGKTTIAEACARYFGTEWVPEYGAVYWAENQVSGILSHAHLNVIARQQLRMEQELRLTAHKYLFCDTTVLTTKMFCDYYHGYSDAELAEKAETSMRDYDIVFVCDTDVPFDPSQGRRPREVNQAEHRKLIDELNLARIPWILLSGSVQARLDQVTNVLHKFDKFDRRMHHP